MPTPPNPLQETLIGTASAVLGGLVAGFWKSIQRIIGIGLKSRSIAVDEKNADTSHSAAVMDGFSKLVTGLEGRIDAQDERISSLEKLSEEKEERIKALEADKAELEKAKNIALKSRDRQISLLNGKIKRLQGEVAALKEELAKVSQS